MAVLGFGGDQGPERGVNVVHGLGMVVLAVVCSHALDSGTSKRNHPGDRGLIT